MNTLAVVPMGIFDTVGGLPLHPLVVHLAVVMLPLATLALMAIIIAPGWRASYGWLTMAALSVGAGGAFLAAQTGEALAQQVGLPQDHARWGDLLEKAAMGLFVVAVIWFVLQRRESARTPGNTPRVLGPWAQATAAVLSIVMAVGVLVLTVVVGHSGATAVWADQVPATSPAASAAVKAAPVVPKDAPLASPSPEGSAVAITMSEVQQHSTAASCWSVVDTGVYDLTAWIPQHPGGEAVLKVLCGTDGSVAFHNEHATQGKSSATLAEFRIGILGH